MPTRRLRDPSPIEQSQIDEAVLALIRGGMSISEAYVYLDMWFELDAQIDVVTDAQAPGLYAKQIKGAMKQVTLEIYIPSRSNGGWGRVKSGPTLYHWTFWFKDYHETITLSEAYENTEYVFRSSLTGPDLLPDVPEKSRSSLL